jgi:hypothetical protein
MRRLKLGKLLDILPEHLALGRPQHLRHHDFLEMLFAHGKSVGLITLVSDTSQREDEEFEPRPCGSHPVHGTNGGNDVIRPVLSGIR